MLAIDTIVVPQGAEYQAVARGLQTAKVKNIKIIAIPIGVKSIDRFLADHQDKLKHTAGILLMGLGGSLSPSYRVGDSVLVTGCMDFDHNLVHLDSKLAAQIANKIPLATVVSLTSDRIITQAAEKSALAKAYQADILEMEGYGYVTKLQQQGIPVAMLRVISDNLDDELPDLNLAVDSQGNLATLPLAIALIKQPIAAIKLIKGSLTGLKALEQTTARLFLALVI